MEVVVPMLVGLTMDGRLLSVSEPGTISHEHRDVLIRTCEAEGRQAVIKGLLTGRWQRLEHFCVDAGQWGGDDKTPTKPRQYGKGDDA